KCLFSQQFVAEHSDKLESLSQREQQFIKQQHIAELGEVTRGLAHALRNPINTIGLSLEQMALPQTTAQQRQKLAVAARTKINVIDHTIKSLLTLATNENLTSQPVNINAIILDVMLELSMTSGHNIQFTEPPALMIDGIESELRAIIHTIVVNATEANADQLPIIIAVIEQATNIVITVTDSGSGIADVIYPDLFKPHITTKPEGAGMGLYIAKRLCQLHYHGDLTLINRDDRGCVATITLSTQQETTNESN
ncbi:MAG: HAMP domain-containing histidine kinase, partial [Gammaproteobacteria bacterium]|nr:HAMP domain-containing histidine kinase [Gammaproteobacteria bacterium]